MAEAEIIIGNGSVTVNARGFEPNQTVNLNLQSTPVPPGGGRQTVGVGGQGTCDDRGDFTVTFAPDSWLIPDEPRALVADVYVPASAGVFAHASASTD